MVRWRVHSPQNETQILTFSLLLIDVELSNFVTPLYRQILITASLQTRCIPFEIDERCINVHFLLHLHTLINCFMEFNLVNLAFNLLPAVIVALIAYYFFSQYTKNEEGRRRFLLHKESQATALPLRLQAYER